MDINAAVGSEAGLSDDRLLAVVDLVRHPEFPDVPTLREALPEADIQNWFGIFAPAGTPAAILDRLEREFIAILKEPAVFQSLTQQGVEIMAMPRGETRRFVQREIAKYAELVKFSGAKVD